MNEPKNVCEMSVRQINAYFRKHDESKLWPVCGRFNATERAIRSMRRFRRASGCANGGLEYYLCLESTLSEIVNNC